jgi:hypothetical protein
MNIDSSQASIDITSSQAGRRIVKSSMDTCFPSLKPDLTQKATRASADLTPALSIKNNRYGESTPLLSKAHGDYGQPVNSMLNSIEKHPVRNSSTTNVKGALFRDDSTEHKSIEVTGKKKYLFENLEISDMIKRRAG